MIASSAALFAVLATLAAGHKFTVLPNAVTRDQAIAACANAGLQLAAITGATIEQVSAQLPAGSSGWIASWNSDSYGGACLQLKSGTITAAASCAEHHLPVCEGEGHPVPPCPSSSSYCPSSSSSSSCTIEPSCSSSTESCPSSSSSSCTEFSSSSSSCELSSDSWSSSECDVSSSFSCSDSLSSDICSSSSSSSEVCDPCCAGVRKLTYQAPFGPGIYLAKVAQRFSVFDVFGPNACANVATLAATLGVNATLVGSDGLNACNALDTTPYGTFYVVSRAWALNQPIYALYNGVVNAANSLFNCYGEYRAIFLEKPLSELTFVTNPQGDVCFERCRDKPRSCVALCQNEFARPGYLSKFKVGH
jgi:hypothetical protein